MIGLQKEIERRREGLQLTKKEILSYSNIAKIIGKPYNTTKRKIESGTLTATEAIKIFDAIPFKTRSVYSAFVYLFTEEGE